MRIYRRKRILDDVRENMEHEEGYIIVAINLCRTYIFLYIFIFFCVQCVTAADGLVLSSIITAASSHSRPQFT